MKDLRKKYIGDKAFYKSVIVLVIPLIIQQGITNFVSLLDNVMVGGLGTTSISSVAIVNQLVFVFNLSIFGVVSGASIFGAQFAGKDDNKGLRETFRFKMIFGAVATIIAITIFIVWGEDLILNFLRSEVSDPDEIKLSLGFAKDYLSVCLFGLPAFMVVQSYAGTLREKGETVAPMFAGVLAIVLNLSLNYIFIFGHLGAPKLGVVGAALGTVISRYAELLYIVIFTHKHKFKFEFIVGAYKSLHIDPKLLKQIIITGSPLMVNEILWSIGMTVINQSYSIRGLQVVAGINITSTVVQLFNIIMFAMGHAVCIIVGQALGAGDIEKAKDTDNKLIVFTVVFNIVIAIILVIASPFIPLLYNTEQEVRQMASQFLIVSAITLPLHALVHVIYFTLRSGGKTLITFFFDSFYTWVIPVPISFVLSRYTNLPVVWVYCVIQSIDLIKACIGIPLLKSGFWAKNIINK